MPKENFNLAALRAEVPEEVRQRIAASRPLLTFDREVCKPLASGIVAALILGCDVMLFPNPMKQTVWRHRGCGGIVESELASTRDRYFPMCSKCGTRLDHSNHPNE